MSLSHCTECNSIEGKVNGKIVDGEIVDICGECGSDRMEYLPEDDPREDIHEELEKEQSGRDLSVVNSINRGGY